MARPSSTQRGYDGRWEAFAARFLEAYPLCLGCQAIGVQREATVVDHVIPHEGDQSRFWLTDFQPACKWHHDSIKPMLERQWKAGKLSDVGLRLNSPQAVKLTKQRHRPAIGAGGFAIPGT